MRKGPAFVHRNAARAVCQRFGRKLWKTGVVTTGTVW